MTITRTNPDLNLAIGQRVRKRRHELGLRQKALAERIEIHQAHLSNVEHGAQNISAAVLWRLSSALGVTIDWLVKGEEGG